MTDQLLIGLLFSCFISIASCRAGFLNGSGASAQFVLGVVLLGFGGWKWTIPMLAFFFLSSLLSFIGKSRRARAELYFEKSSRRDAGQVIANGGVAGVLAILGLIEQHDAIYIAYLGSIAAATADTWGTEIGTLSRGRPFLITTLERVEPGRSGAVSILGLIAGIAGACLIWLCGVAWTHQNDSGRTFTAVVVGGFLGSIADSMAGAAVQGLFRCQICTRTTEREFHCGQQAVFASGFRFLRNDQVNFLCTMIGAAVGLLLFVF